MGGAHGTSELRGPKIVSVALREVSIFVKRLEREIKSWVISNTVAF